MFTIRKSLGQHFLKDENICRRIVDVLHEKPFNQLLEIGPGGGALTRYLVEIENINLKAVELDEEKIHYLLRLYPQLQGKLIHENMLEMERPFEGQFTVIGNFPYNISSQILFKVLEWKNNVECMIGMFQKEVAQRIVAREGNKTYGVMSVLVQAFFDVEYRFEVSENSFQPPPKVKSAVIRLTPKKQRLDFRSDKDFFVLVKAAFNQRRKTLRNAVRGLFDAAILEHELFNKRAEQLRVADFAELTFKMDTAIVK